MKCHNQWGDFLCRKIICELIWTGGTTHFVDRAISLCQKAVKSYRLLLCYGGPQPDAQSQKLCPLVPTFPTFQSHPPSQFHHLQYNYSPKNRFYTKSHDSVASWGSIRMPLHLERWSHIELIHASTSQKKLRNLRKP